MRTLILAVSAVVVLGAGVFLLRKSNVSSNAERLPGPQLISSAEEGWTSRAKKAIEASGTNALPSLVALIKNKGDNGQTSLQLALAGFEALGSNGAPAVPALITLLGDQRTEVRSTTIGCLQAIGPAASNAVPDLLACLNDSDPEVRRSVAFALGDIPGPGEMVVPALVTYLDKPHPDTNWAEFEKVVALATLGRYTRQSQLAVSALRRMTNDESFVVRDKAGMYLHSAESPPATPQSGNPIDLYRNRLQTTNGPGRSDSRPLFESTFGTKTYDFAIDDLLLHKESSWRAEKEKLPLTPKHAQSIAIQEAHKLAPDIDHWWVEDVVLRRVDDECWYYEVLLLRGDVVIIGLPPDDYFFKIPVLMSGAAVQPVSTR